MSDRLTAAVEALDPDEVALALDRFTTANPHYQGAHWDDVIDELFNADAHLDITESCDDFAAAVAAVTAHWAGTLPRIATVCRIEIPAPLAPPGIVAANPLVAAFFEWIIEEKIWSVPGTLSAGPHMFIADFPIEYQERIVGWFREHRHPHQMSHGGVQSKG